MVERRAKLKVGCGNLLSLAKAGGGWDLRGLRNKIDLLHVFPGVRCFGEMRSRGSDGNEYRNMIVISRRQPGKGEGFVQEVHG